MMNAHAQTIHANFRTPQKVRTGLSVIAAAGVLLTAVGLLVEPQRTWSSILLAGTYLMHLGLAGIVFIALQYVSNAGWAVAIRRIPEAMSGALWLAALIMAVVVGGGVHALYEWSHDAVVAQDRLLTAKSGWLNQTGFTVRSILYVAVWSAFIVAIIRRSRTQDRDGDVQHTVRNRALSAAFLVVFALTFTLASFDWIMSIEPHWFSTIFGIYNFSGLFLSGLAMITVVVILLRRWGPLAGVVTESHLHDLGKLIFAFSTFWMYIWFSQYILIWYANIPEEVRYYTAREQGGWLMFTAVNVVFNWIIPFIVLLPIATKRSEGILLRICIIILVGHWIDLFWMIQPTFMAAGPVVFLWEVGPVAGALAGFFLVMFRILEAHPLLPARDPYLVESLAAHH